MNLPENMLEGKLIRRYKRFLAEIELPDGKIVTAHVPNTGRMTQVSQPGSLIMISRAENLSRKLKYTLELVKVAGNWVDVNTFRTNRIVEEALKKDRIRELSGFIVNREYRFGESRFDFMLKNRNAGADVLVEVKNVSMLCGTNAACFPDAPTVRGRKHLKGLIDATKQGFRAVIFFLVQRREAEFFIPAEQVDPEYSKLLVKAMKVGVESVAYLTQVSPIEVHLDLSIPVFTHPENLSR